MKKAGSNVGFFMLLAIITTIILVGIKFIPTFAENIRYAYAIVWKR